MFIQLISRKWDGENKGKRHRSAIANSGLIFVCSIICSLLYYEERNPSILVLAFATSFCRS